MNAAVALSCRKGFDLKMTIKKFSKSIPSSSHPTIDKTRMQGGPSTNSHNRMASSSLRNVYSADESDEDIETDGSESQTVVNNLSSPELSELSRNNSAGGRLLTLARSESNLDLFLQVAPAPDPPAALNQAVAGALGRIPIERNNQDGLAQWNNNNPRAHQQQHQQQRTTIPRLLPASDARSDLMAFALSPVPYPHEIRCKIERTKSFASGGKTFPAYELFIEDDVRQVFLLSARKQNFMSKSSHYVISTDRLSNWSRTKENIVANVRSNFIGTAFSVYDNAEGSSKMKFGSHEEFCAVLYEPNILGVKGPRKMTVILPGMNKDKTRCQLRPQSERDTLLFRSKRDVDKDIHITHNKTPQWNPDTESFVLNFNTRVTMASVKNFQIVHDHDLDYIMMQFGRVEAHKFTMDFKYPMTAVQAFGIALTSFDAKLACE